MAAGLYAVSRNTSEFMHWRIQVSADPDAILKGLNDRETGPSLFGLLASWLALVRLNFHYVEVGFQAIALKLAVVLLGRFLRTPPV